MAILGLAAVLAASCGSDRDEPDASDGEQPETTEAGADKEVTFGDMASPCGEGEGDGGPPSDVGVTADEIHIGYGDDAGFPGSPGLHHEMSEAVEAMIAWCNDQGGINGRKIKGTYYDAKITDINNALIRACSDKVFMLVGEGYALDSAGEETRLGCGLPAFPGYSVSPQFSNATLMYAALPNPVDYQAIGDGVWMVDHHPDEAKKLGFMYANYAATIDTAMKQKSTLPEIGMVDLGCDQVYTITGEADWKPFVQRLKDCGAETAIFIGSFFPNFQNVLDAAAQLKYEPYWIVQSNHYDQKFADWNTNGYGDKVYVRSQDVPHEYADRNKATKDYLDIVAANGGTPSGLGAHSASAFLYWADSVKACGAEVTRECVLEKAAQEHTWTAGGLHAPTDPGDNKPSECETIVKMEGTKWVQVYPEEPGQFFCDPRNVGQVTGEIVDRHSLVDRKIPPDA